MPRVYSQQREEINAVVVDWNVGNTCGLACHYCDSWFKRGNNPFPKLEPACSILDRIAEPFQKSNRPLSLSIVGGEPTEWHDLPALIQHADRLGFAVALASNGQASDHVWRSLLPYLRTLRLTHHATADWETTLRVAHTARHSFIDVSIAFAMSPEHFDQQLARHGAAAQQGFAAALQPLYRDHVRRTQLLDYAADQIAVLFPQETSGDLVMEGQETVSMSVDRAIYEQRNSFTGMRCGIGTDQIVIDQDGTIRGGWCRVGETLGNVHRGEFSPPAEPVRCTRAICSNPLDLAVPKWSEDAE